MWMIEDTGVNPALEYQRLKVDAERLLREVRDTERMVRAAKQALADAEARYRACNDRKLALMKEVQPAYDPLDDIRRKEEAELRYRAQVDMFTQELRMMNLPEFRLPQFTPEQLQAARRAGHEAALRQVRQEQQQAVARQDAILRDLERTATGQLRVPIERPVRLTPELAPEDPRPPFGMVTITPGDVDTMVDPRTRWWTPRPRGGR